MTEGHVSQDLRSIWFFAQVADAGSFSAAAERLQLSTAALSKSISRLERHIGVRLFVRTPRKLHLTGEGRALLDGVGSAFRSIEETMAQVSGSSAEPVGVVRLSTVTAYGKNCVLPLLPRFLARYPGIELVMSLHDGGRGLSRQTFDVRLNWGEEREKDKVSQTLCRMPLILVASPAYLRARGTPQCPADLAAHDCINVALAGGQRAHWTFVSGNGNSRRSLVVPRGRLTIMDELAAVTDAAEAGLGLTVTSAENVLAAITEGRLVRVMEDYEVLGHGQVHSDVIIQYAAKKQLPQKVRVLVDFLLENLKGRDPLELVREMKVQHEVVALPSR